MAEINDIDLKLNILATDEASEVLKALSGVLDDLKENLAAFADLNPFADLQDIADSLASAIKDLNDGITNLKDTFSELDTTGLPTLIDQMGQINEQGASLRATLTGVQDEMAGMAAEGRDNPLTGWNNTANELRTALTGVLDETSNVDDTAKADPFSGWSAAVQGVKEQLDGVVADLRLIGELSKTSFNMPSVTGGTKKGGVTPISESQMLDWFASLDQSKLTPEQRAEYARAGVNNDVPSFYNQYGAELGAPQPTVVPPAEPELAPEAGGFKIPSVVDAIGGVNGYLSHIPHQLMNYGMLGMMGYYGVQGLANSENQFADIQQMMNLNNQTVNEAAQSSVMLGTVGMSGTAGTSFLSNLAGNMQNLFTPQVGSGALSKNAILLQSLGITQQDITTSPWELLNTIGTRYRSLISQGQGNKAAQLLSLTGTSQVQPLLENWGTLQQGASGVNLNMTPAQLGDAVKQNDSLQENLQTLSLAFGELAIKLDPIVNAIVKALTDLGNGLSGKTGIVTTIGNIVKDLGPVGDAIAGLVLAVKGASLALSIKKMFSGGGPVTVSGSPVVVEGGGGGEPPAGGTPAGEEEPVVPVEGEAAAGEAIGEGAAAGVEAAGEDMAVSGAVAGAEGVGLGLDATGVLAPLGIAIGALAPVVGYAVANWNTIGPALSKAGSDVGNWAVKTGDEIGDWTSTHAKDLGDWAQKTGANIGSWATTQTQDISNWATKTGGNIENWASTHTTDIVNWANTTGANVSNWATTHTNDLVSWADQTGANIGYWASAHTTDIGNWADTTGSQIGTWAITHTQDIENWATNTGNSISSWYNSTVSVIGNWVKQVAGDFGVTLTNIGNDIGQGVNSVVNWMSQAASNISNTVGSLFRGGNVSSWIQTAMADTGVSGSTWTNVLTQLVQAESGGNPNAINSTAVDGEHAEGIAQMLPSTFAAHMMQGLSDILNPVDNLVSSIRYIMGRYGTPENLISLTGLGTGNYKGYATGGILDEPIVGIGLSTGTRYSFAEAGPEAIVPMSGGRIGGGSGLAMARGGTNVNQTFNMTITIPTSARDSKTMAQQILTEVVNNLKRKGNFEWS